MVWLTSCRTDPVGQGDKNDRKVQRKLIWEKVGGTWLKDAPRAKGTAQEWLWWLLWVAGLCTALLHSIWNGMERGTELNSAFRRGGIRAGCFPEWDTCLL